MLTFYRAPGKCPSVCSLDATVRTLVPQLSSDSEVKPESTSPLCLLPAVGALSLSLHVHAMGMMTLPNENEDPRAVSMK